MTECNYILFDPKSVSNLLPLAYTKAIADFRIGIFTIHEKWELYLEQAVQILTRSYLQEKYAIDSKAANTIYINSAVLPDASLIKAISELKVGQVLTIDGVFIAFYTSNQNISSLEDLYVSFGQAETLSYNSELNILSHNWDLFSHNGSEIKKDIEFIGKEKSNHNFENALAVKNSQQIFVEDGAVVESCILNATDGPIYIGEGAKILDGAIVKGPVSINAHAVVKAGAKIYGETTIGPHCKVGGEVSNSILMGFSNKGHDGYLGNSVIGEWCNLGADTNTSNLKNNYSLVKSWSYTTKAYVNTQLQFCGLVMGDHSKCGINTMFNTATVVGVAANIYGGDFPVKFIPSFSWGGSGGFTTFKLEKVFEMATNMMKRRGLEFTALDKKILEHIFNTDQQFRN